MEVAEDKRHAITHYSLVLIVSTHSWFTAKEVGSGVKKKEKRIKKIYIYISFIKIINLMKNHNQYTSGSYFTRLVYTIFQHLVIIKNK